MPRPRLLEKPIMMTDDEWETFQCIVNMEEKKRFVDKVNLRIGRGAKDFFGKVSYDYDFAKEEAEYNLFMDEYEEKYERRMKIEKFIFNVLSFIVRCISFLARAVGTFSLLGLPFGLFGVHRIVSQLNENVPFSEVTHRTSALLFFVLPITAFIVHFLTDKLANYLSFKGF